MARICKDVSVHKRSTRCRLRRYRRLGTAGAGRAEWYYPDHQYVESWTDVSHSKAPGTESAACCAATLDATARSTTCSIANTHATEARLQPAGDQAAHITASRSRTTWSARVPPPAGGYPSTLHTSSRAENTFSPGIVVHRSDSSRSTRNKTRDRHV